MNNITKYNLKTTIISVAGLILLYSALAFLIAPQSDGFLWSSVNPLELLEGVVFALGFGLGVPVWLSVIVIGLVSFLLFAVFLRVARKIVK